MGRPRGFDEEVVMRAAVGLFGRRSYDGTSVDDLVSGLGVHRGTLYNTFGSKRGVYLAALRHHVDHDVAEAARRSAEGGPDLGLLLMAPDLGLLLMAMVERAPVDPEVAAETDRALSLLDEAGDAALVLGLLLRARATGNRSEGE
ncbi:MAG: helix-turn-helix domain-containing protein [Actinoplanes sp.]